MNRHFLDEEMSTEHRVDLLWSQFTVVRQKERPLVSITQKYEVTVAVGTFGGPKRITSTIGRIQAIKLIREMTNSGLLEAKLLADRIVEREAKLSLYVGPEVSIEFSAIQS